MESFHSDIILEILSRVPAESVLQCKLVCKKWVTVIRGSNFAIMHFRHQLNKLYRGDDGNDNLAARVEPCLFFACCIDDPDEYITLLFHGKQVNDIGDKYNYSQNLKRIYHSPMHNDPLFDHLVGSCNGLVCAFQHHHLVINPIYICNPLTREYVHLPQLVVKKEDLDPVDPDESDDDRIVGGEVRVYTACGFGYVRSTNEYKVVRIYYIDFMEGNVEVYTLGSGRGWRAIGKISYILKTVAGGVGTYANDAIYWISSNGVVAFDLADEVFQLLSVPPRMENRTFKDICGLVTLGRHLCLYTDDEIHVQIWSLIKSSVSKETWRMEFDIDYQAILGTRRRKLQPILLTKKGEIIFLYARSVLYCFDPKTRNLKIISDEASTDNFEAIEAIAHVNTIASLEAMGEISKRYTVLAPLDDVIDELDRVGLGREGIDTTRFRLG